jgi:translin
MLDKNFWTSINEAQATYDKSRRIIIGQANNALHLSKQAIFASHRDNIDEAKGNLKEALEILQQLEKDFKQDEKLRTEGSWAAAVEEFVEANLFLQFLEGHDVGEVEGIVILSQEYLGGFSDYTGELLRRAVLLATKKDFEAVSNIAEEIKQAIELMLQYNLTGQLRNKFDQAKRNQQKIEHIMYEISLKTV